MIEVDSRNVNQFESDLLSITGDFPKETKKFMKEEAKELKKVTLQEMSSKVKKKTGNLRKGIKAGKVYRYQGNLAVRVYGGKPAHHAHLIDRGHRIVTPRRWRGKIRNHGGEEKGRARAFPFFESSAKSFEPKFEKDCEEFIDNLIVGRIGE